jgi:hypothetical protein
VWEWVTEGVLTVVNVWSTDAKAAQLQQVLKSVDDDQGGGLGQRHSDLEQEMVDYVRRAIEYKWGVSTGGWPSIASLRAAELGGALFNPNNPDIADSYALMNDAPRLRGLVEEFKRDLRIAVVRETGAVAR